MTRDELAQQLQAMRAAAPAGEMTPFTHLFGIRYASELTGWSVAELKELCEVANVAPSMGTEIHKMVKLAKYVGEKE